MRAVAEYAGIVLLALIGAAAFTPKRPPEEGDRQTEPSIAGFVENPSEIAAIDQIVEPEAAELPELSEGDLELYTEPPPEDAPVLPPPAAPSAPPAGGAVFCPSGSCAPVRQPAGRSYWRPARRGLLGRWRR
jgi:hypothetical protein